MAVLSVDLDLSFIEPALEYVSSPSRTMLDTIVAHPAAKGVHSHALRNGNTEKRLADFWEERLAKITPDTVNRARSSLDYIEENPGEFGEAFNELTKYIPPDLDIECKLYGELGYDIGIASDGDAYLNLGHSQFVDKRELIYFAMHELHHVAYLHYQPMFFLSGLETLEDLKHVVMYCTHVEGLAVFAPYDKRKREEKFNHTDYRLYNEPDKLRWILDDYHAIWDKLNNQAARRVTEEDFGIIERLSGERLWYVTGLHMAKTIDERLGRDALTRTMEDGPESFFRLYDECLP